MNRPVKRRLIVPAVIIVALAGGAVAVAANSSSSSPRQAYLDSVASHLGVSSEKLTAAMRAAATERIQAAVASGHLSKQQGEVLEQRVKEGRGPIFGGGLGERGAGGRGHALTAAAAGYLGVSPQTLRSERREGKSLAQIAGSTPGRSAAGLKAVLLAAAGKQLDAAAATGRLSPARVQMRRARLPQLVEMLIQRSGTGPGTGALGAGGHRGASVSSRSAAGASS